MSFHDDLRALGLFDARVPRYTSYPPANHFSENVTNRDTAAWISAIPAGAPVSLYVHIPYCRRLCWFCACRTQGTSTDRPLVPYLDKILRELELVGAHLDPDVVVSEIHLGGGTPTLLPPDMIARLVEALRRFRPLSDDLRFSVEIDPTEVDRPRIEALARAGMSRASIGVQDFDPVVQAAIGREQSFEQTRAVCEMLRENGIDSLNMDILYGLPHQSRERLSESVQRVLSLNPDRVALYGYAHVPWMAKRQVMIPSEALPDATERLELFETARKLFLWDGYDQIGIDHFARPNDSMATAAQSGALKRNFQGYTAEVSNVLIGLGASAISRYPQGFAQNHSTSSSYAKAIEAGELATLRGHAMDDEDALRSDMIEHLMCDFALDYPRLAAAHKVPVTHLRSMARAACEQFSGWIEEDQTGLRLTREPALIARLVAQTFDAYQMPDGRHSRAL